MLIFYQCRWGLTSHFEVLVGVLDLIKNWTISDVDNNDIIDVITRLLSHTLKYLTSQTL